MDKPGQSSFKAATDKCVFPFLRLPAELRNLVYNYCWVGDGIKARISTSSASMAQSIPSGDRGKGNVQHALYYTVRSFDLINGHPPKGIVALACSNRLLRREICPLFYTALAFYSPKDVLSFLSNEERRDMVKCSTIVLKIQMSCKEVLTLKALHDLFEAIADLKNVSDIHTNPAGKGGLDDVKMPVGRLDELVLIPGHKAPVCREISSGYQRDFHPEEGGIVCLFEALLNRYTVTALRRVRGLCSFRVKYWHPESEDWWLKWFTGEEARHSDYDLQMLAGHLEPVDEIGSQNKAVHGFSEVNGDEGGTQELEQDQKNGWASLLDDGQGVEADTGRYNKDTMRRTILKTWRIVTTEPYGR